MGSKFGKSPSTYFSKMFIDTEFFFAFFTRYKVIKMSMFSTIILDNQGFALRNVK